MTSDKTTKWVEDVLLTRILKYDDLQGAIIKKSEVRAMQNMKDNWASDMYEINLILYHHGNTVPVSLLLKRMCEDETVRNMIQSDKQFFNEIHFYSTVMPLLRSQTSHPHLKSRFENLFPECYYSYYNEVKRPQSFEDAVLVMENLKARGFQLGDRRSLDLKHLSLALRCLGIFHAFSYFMKENKYTTFENVVVKPIEETKYVLRNKEIFDTLFRQSEERVIKGLEKELPEDDPRLVRLKELAARSPYDLLADLTSPKEPLAVLCHGDFLRNNVLFKYNEGEPLEMKFIDFQTVRYASPAIDVSLLLCMSTTHELRTTHFDELLQTYHTSLTNTLSLLLEIPKDQLNECYNFESFLADFRHHAAYGYLITIWFLPWMYAGDDELAAFVKLSWEEISSPRFMEAAWRLGGENATSALGSLTKDLLMYQCL